jgi:hypothetical protein
MYRGIIIIIRRIDKHIQTVSDKIYRISTWIIIIIIIITFSNTNLNEKPKERNFEICSKHIIKSQCKFRIPQMLMFLIL